MSDTKLTVLIVGGYGTFGGRLARLLAGEPGVKLLIAGRNIAKARAFCDTHLAGADAEPVVFDRDGDIIAALGAYDPDLVVDASGPFQDYPGDVYKLVRACIGGGVNYIDLADASAFVLGIGQFNDMAREHNCFALTGASSYPTLSAAVMRHLTEPMPRVETITAGIAPSPHATLGKNVVVAGISYAGKPIELIYRGQPVTGYALAETRRSTIAPPGVLPLKNRLFSLVDVPDNQLMLLQWHGLKAIWFGFSPGPDLPQRGFNIAANLVRYRLLPSLKPFAPIIARLASWLRWGEDRSGMFVAIAGRGEDGTRTERTWHLIAEDDHGPFIPAMAIAAVVRRCLAGRTPEPGARPAIDDVDLADYEALFKKFSMRWGVRDEGPSTAKQPLYRRLLGSAWDDLPALIQAMHDLDGTMVAEGRARVTRGKSFLARLAGRVIGFPGAGDDIPVKVTFAGEDGHETWHRDFAGQTFESVQLQGRGRSAYLLNERFGAMTVGLALVVADGRLHLTVRRWSLFGIAMPMMMAPRSHAYESVEDGRFNFHVDVSLPLAGHVAGYHGWLEPRPLTADEEAAIARSKTDFARATS